jgi:hypothetical protein
MEETLYKVEITYPNCGYVRSKNFKDYDEAKAYLTHINTSLDRNPGICVKCFSAKRPHACLSVESKKFLLGDNKALTGNYPAKSPCRKPKDSNIESEDEKLRRINAEIKRANHPCFLCGGKGTIEVSKKGHTQKDIRSIMTEECPICLGKGYIDERPKSI